MPLKRTPPTSPKMTLSQTSESPTKICVTLDMDDLNTVSKNKKRRFDECSSNMSPFLNKIQSMFDTFKGEQNHKFDTLHSTIKEQNAELQRSIEFISAKYDEVLNKCSQLENLNRQNTIYIKHLENKIERFEADSCSTSIEIRNVPEKNPETKDTLRDIVQNIGTLIEHPIKNEDIRQIRRMKTKQDATGNIIVQFTTTYTKESIIRLSKKFNINNNSNHLNTSHLKINGPPKLIFINEHLTPKMKHLHYLARQFAKEHNYKYCWASFGIIYLRRKEGEVRIRINEEDDLNKLKKEA